MSPLRKKNWALCSFGLLRRAISENKMAAGVVDDGWRWWLRVGCFLGKTGCCFCGATMRMLIASRRWFPEKQLKRVNVARVSDEWRCERRMVKNNIGNMGADSDEKSAETWVIVCLFAHTALKYCKKNFVRIQNLISPVKMEQISKFKFEKKFLEKPLGSPVPKLSRNLSPWSNQYISWFDNTNLFKLTKNWSKID